MKAKRFLSPGDSAASATPVTPTLTIKAYDVRTGAEIKAEIYRNGVFTGFATPHTFTGAYILPGDYFCQKNNYGQWLPEEITIASVMGRVTLPYYAVPLT